jgi:membrane protein
MKLYSLAFWEGILDQWLEDKVMTLSAALAYFAAFSIAPVLVICIIVTSFAFGKQVAENQLILQLGTFIGKDNAEQLSNMIASVNSASFNTTTGIVAVIVLLLGASGFFGQLLEGLNTIWHVRAKTGRIRGIIRRRTLSFVLVVAMGVITLLSITLSVFLNFFKPIIHLALFFQIMNFVTSLILVTLIFALLFKFLPDVRLTTKDVIEGSLFSGLLYECGKFILTWGLRHMHLSSKYGAASSFVVILFWLFYSGQVIFIGAEFIKVNAKRCGKEIFNDKII